MRGVLVMEPERLAVYGEFVVSAASDGSIPISSRIYAVVDRADDGTATQHLVGEFNRLRAVNAELLAVLREVVAVAVGDSQTSMLDAVRDARAAIAKAEGK